MRKIYFLLLTAFIGISVTYAQVSGYSFVASSGSYTALTSSTNSTAAGDDGSQTGIPIGFSFNYGGSTYSTIGVSTNGFAFFGTLPSSSWTNSLSTGLLVVAPLWDDNNLGSGSIRYSTTGSAGNRVFTIEWANINVGGSGSSTNPTISMQLRLFEGTNVIQLIYGPTSAALASTTASIGLSGAVAGNFLSVTPLSPVASSTASSVTENSSISSASNFPSGTTYTFTPPPACVAPTAQPTSLSLSSTATTITGSFSAAAGSPSGYLVIRTTTSTPPLSPVDGTTYTVGSSSLNGVVVHSGSATSFSASSLLQGTSYFFWVYSYNTLCLGQPAYLAATPLSGSAATLSCGSGLSGVKTIGTGGDYLSLSAALSDLSTCGVSGPVTLSLLSTYSSAIETFPITITAISGSSITNTITIKPAAGVNAVIQGSTGSTTNTALIRINGASFINIDGSNTVGGTSQNLTIINLGASTSSAVISLNSTGTSPSFTAPNNCSIRNCIIKGASPSTTLAGIYSGGSVFSGSFSTVATSTNNSAAPQSNISFVNNRISSAQQGIVVQGFRSASPYNSSFNISNNSIGSQVASEYIGVAGISANFLVLGSSVISNNSIFNIITSSANPTGIRCIGLANTTISGNNISSIRYTGTSGYGGKGIEVANAFSGTTNVAILNNMISDVRGDGWNNLASDAVVGIRLGSAWGASSTTGGGLRVYNNTVNISSGTFNGSASGTLSAAFYVHSTVTGTIDVRNNIFTSNLVNSNAALAKTYAIYSAAPVTSFATINYNNYFVSGTQGVLGYLTSDRTNLAGIVTGFGGNANSLNRSTTFVSVSDGHINTGSADNLCLNGAGSTLSAIPDDIDGDTRNSTTPDIGADEFSPTALVVTNQTVCTPSIVDLTASTVTTGSASGLVLTYFTDAACTSSLTSPSSVATSGTYYIKATNSSGCSMVSPVVVTINTSPSPTISGAASVCANSTGNVYSVSNNAGNTYVWSVTGGTITSGAGTNSITVTWGVAGAGVVSVTETVTATGCATTATSNVTVNPNPTPSITGSNAGCALLEGNSYSVANVAGNTYSWSVTGGAVASGTGTNAITVTWGAASSASVTVTQTVSSTGCSTQATANVTVIESPTATAAVVEPVTCASEDGKINLTLGGAAGPYTFAWTGTGNGLSATTQNQSAVSTGFYNVTVTAANGCTVTIPNIVVSGPGGCFICPTVGTISSTATIICQDGANTITAGGLADLGITYGIRFKYSATPLANPYLSTAGTVMGTVTNANLTVVGGTTTSTSASITYNFPTAGTMYVYAILSPASPDPACRPFKMITVEVAPTPVLTDPADQALCTGSATSAVSLVATPSATTTFAWTNNRTSIGLAASGTGNIPSFTATNFTNAPVTATVTVTPTNTQTLSSFVNLSPVPGNMVAYRANVGTVYSMTLTGQASGGTIWGTNIYTDDSYLNVAAVHAGVLAAGQTATVYVEMVAGQSSYTSSTQNGVTSAPYGSWGGSYRFVSSSGSGSASTTVTCPGPAQSYTYTVNPIPTVNTVTDQKICAGTNVSLPFSGFVAGTVFDWTNSNTSIGLAASGAGTLSFTATNTTSSPITATIIVTPKFTNAGVTCTGNPISFDITVNPTPAVAAVPEQVLCSGSATTAISLTSATTGTAFSWTNSATSIGLAATGTGTTIASFTAVNTGAAPVNAILTITPSYTGAGFTCTGTAGTTTITVNPIPSTTGLSNSVICNGAATTYTLAGPVTAATYNWTNSNTAIGLAGTGSGTIAFTASNTTGAPITSTIEVTPSITNGGLTCVGGTSSFTVTVNPSGQVNAIDNQTLCNGSATSAVTFSTVNNGLISTGGTQVASSGTISVAVPDASAVGATHTIPVTLPTGAVITNMRVTMNMTHTWISDMIINLRAPNGQVLNLFNGHGGSGDNLVNTVISSTGTASLASGTAPFTGTFAATAAAGVGPTGNASTAANFAALYSTANGNWVLSMRDLFLGDLGTLTGWSISFDYVVQGQFGTNMNWTNSLSSIGLAASGTGNIPSFTAVNTGAAPVTSTVTVTPTYFNAGTSCPGTPASFTYTVNPTPTVNVVANQVFCAGTPSTVNFSGATTGTVYNWTSSNTAIGLAASGSGNLSFTPTNTSNVPIVSTITVTPVFTNGGVTCTGTPRTFTITVNPVGQVNTVSNQVICNGAGTAAVNFATVNGGGTVQIGTPVTVNSGAITVAVPDFNPAGVTHSLPVTLPAGATITGVSVNFNMTHTWLSDMVINLRAPNGQILNLVNRRGGSGDNFVNTTISSASTTSLATGAAPFTGTFAADAAAGVGPTTFVSTATNFAALYGVANGDWTLGMRDYAGGDLGTLTGWSITFNYTTIAGAVTTYNWTNNTPSIGLAASGVGNIASFAAVNTSTVPVTATVSVIPTYTNAGVGCAGPASSFTYTVNPTPTVNAVSNQTVCRGSNVAAISYGGTVPGTVYNWTNSNTAIGLAASGTGDIASFVGTNTTSAPISATITVTPVFTNAGITCTGTPRTFTITVNPIPTVNPVASFPVCHNSVAAVTFSGATTGTVYSWTNTNTTIGLAASGSGNLNFTALNTTSAPTVATITVTPRFTNGGTTCTGTPITFNITVNPLPVVSAGTLPARICISDTLVPLNGTPVGGSWSGIGTSGMNFVPTATALGTWPITYTFSDINGCTNRATIAATVLACEERDRDLDNSAVLLYPNPNSGQFNLRINSTRFNALGMRVFNTAGQLVSTKQWSGLVFARVVPVNLTNLPAGIYMVRLYYGDGMDRGADKTYQIVIAR